MMKIEEKFGVPGSVLAHQDKNWDDNVWCGMEWEEAETLCPAPTIWEGRLSKAPPRGGEVVCLAPSCEGGVVYNTSYSGGGAVCPDPSIGGEEVCPATPNRGIDQRCCGPVAGTIMKRMRQAKGNI